jgi:hypothetical protein
VDNGHLLPHSFLTYELSALIVQWNVCSFLTAQCDGKEMTEVQSTKNKALDTGFNIPFSQLTIAQTHQILNITGMFLVP